MKQSTSPCYAVGSPISRVIWRERMNDSGPMMRKAIYWRADFPTDRLKKLCRWSQSKEWYKYKERHFARQCEDIGGFRFAVIEEIKRLRAELTEKQKREFDRMRRRMNPPKRKISQFSHELTPSVKAWSVFVDARMKFTDLSKSADNWDAANRADVIESIEKLESFLAGERLKLQR